MKGPGRIRIIAGQWRGRRLAVPAAPGLRPTPDRVRETLFNWLAPRVPGARCLDLFAGSGALGLEAASRGAGEVVLVERSRPVVAALEAAVAALGAGTVVRVVAGDALDWLAPGRGPFDLIFLDPPYAGGLLDPALAVIHRAGLLAPGGRLYLEDRRADVPLPPGWRILRQGRAGEVRFALVTGPEPPG